MDSGSVTSGKSWPISMDSSGPMSGKSGSTSMDSSSAMSGESGSGSGSVGSGGEDAVETGSESVGPGGEDDSVAVPSPGVPLSLVPQARGTTTIATTAATTATAEPILAHSGIRGFSSGCSGSGTCVPVSTGTMGRTTVWLTASGVSSPLAASSREDTGGWCGWPAGGGVVGVSCDRDPVVGLGRSDPGVSPTYRPESRASGISVALRPSSCSTFAIAAAKATTSRCRSWGSRAMACDRASSNDAGNCSPRRGAGSLSILESSCPVVSPASDSKGRKPVASV